MAALDTSLRHVKDLQSLVHFFNNYPPSLHDKLLSLLTPKYDSDIRARGRSPIQQKSRQWPKMERMEELDSFTKGTTDSKTQLHASSLQTPVVLNIFKNLSIRVSQHMRCFFMKIDNSSKSSKLIQSVGFSLQKVTTL